MAHRTTDPRLQGQVPPADFAATEGRLVAWLAVARRRGLWGMAGLLAPLVLAGLILMHGLDAEAVQSMTDVGHEMGAPHASHIEEAPDGDHGCDGCHLAGHVTVACVAVVASVALWRVRRVRLGETDPEQPPPGRQGRADAPAPVPRGHPAWLELSVILR
jgi:uncharacterized protein DUF6153